MNPTELASYAQGIMDSEAMNQPHNTIAIKKSYVDITGDLVTGALLSQIIYWFLPGKNSSLPKASIQRDGRLWIAKTRHEWFDEIRISAEQFDRAISVLEKNRFVTTGVFKFNGNPTKHISINPESIAKSVLLEKEKLVVHGNGYSTDTNPVIEDTPTREPGNSQDHNTYTTSETTSETTGVRTSQPNLNIGNESVNPKPNQKSEAKKTKHREDDPKVIEIYQVYPRQVARLDACKAIAKLLNSGTDAKYLLERTALYRQLRGKDEIEFIPHPATWFNKRRFEDDESSWPRIKREVNATQNGNLSPRQEVYRKDMELKALKEQLRDLNEDCRYAAPEDKQAIKDKVRALEAKLPKELEEEI